MAKKKCSKKLESNLKPGTDFSLSLPLTEEMGALGSQSPNLPPCQEGSLDPAQRSLRGLEERPDLGEAGCAFQREPPGPGSYQWRLARIWGLKKLPASRIYHLGRPTPELLLVWAFVLAFWSPRPRTPLPGQPRKHWSLFHINY